MAMKLVIIALMAAASTACPESTGPLPDPAVAYMRLASYRPASQLTQTFTIEGLFAEYL